MIYLLQIAIFHSYVGFTTLPTTTSHVSNQARPTSTSIWLPSMLMICAAHGEVCTASASINLRPHMTWTAEDRYLRKIGSSHTYMICINSFQKLWLYLYIYTYMYIYVYVYCYIVVYYISTRIGCWGSNFGNGNPWSVTLYHPANPEPMEDFCKKLNNVELTRWTTPRWWHKIRWSKKKHPVGQLKQYMCVHILYSCSFIFIHILGSKSFRIYILQISVDSLRFSPLFSVQPPAPNAAPEQGLLRALGPFLSANAKR